MYSTGGNSCVMKNVGCKEEPSLLWNCHSYPLSPLLLAVIMEAMSQMLIAALDQGNLTGLSMGSREFKALVVKSFTVC